MEKNFTIKDKILAFLTESGIKKADFFEKTGIEPSNFKGKNLTSQPGGDMLVKILSVYPELSSDWLLRDKGEMFNLSDDPNKEKWRKISEKDEKNMDLPKISLEKGQGKPYFDVDFLGGFDEVFNSQVSVPTCNVIVPGFEKAQVWCNVTGHSMEPKISHGDIIALRECSVDDIQYGETYAVVLDTIRTIKILRKGSSPDVLRYVPINTSDFDEQEYPIARIQKIFEVIGSISKFF